MYSFLGFKGYYIPRHSALTNCMNAMRKGVKFEWSEDMEQDFKELKAEFTAGKIQAFTDFNSRKPFIIPTDYSALNIGVILSQKQDGVERFIGCCVTDVRNIIHL